MSVQAGVAIITPEAARDFLTPRQLRPVAQDKVQRYAKEMAGGQWRVTETPILIDAWGRVIKGRHRLAACVASNRPFEAIVITNIEQSMEPNPFLAILKLKAIAKQVFEERGTSVPEVIRTKVMRPTGPVAHA